MVSKGEVVVINRDSYVPLRHIVKIYEPYDEEDFKRWYYSEYYEFDGDEFMYCPTREDRDKLIEGLNKE